MGELGRRLMKQLIEVNGERMESTVMDPVMKLSLGVGLWLHLDGTVQKKYI